MLRNLLALCAVERLVLICEVEVEMEIWVIQLCEVGEQSLDHCLNRLIRL